MPQDLILFAVVIPLGKWTQGSLAFQFHGSVLQEQPTAGTVAVEIQPKNTEVDGLLAFGRAVRRYSTDDIK